MNKYTLSHTLEGFKIHDTDDFHLVTICATFPEARSIAYTLNHSAGLTEFGALAHAVQWLATQAKKSRTS